MTEIVEERGQIETFSLLGGPLHRLGQRLRLVRGGTNTVALGLALGALLWTVPVALAIIGGRTDQVFSLSVIGVHVRLLVVIPLFFLCESMLDPRMTAFVAMLVRSGTVPKDALPALNSAIARTVRRKDSSLPEVICLLAALALPLIAPYLHLSGRTTVYDPSREAVVGPIVGQWYWMVRLTFRFLLIRWLWRLGLWSHFLWRVARLDLKLVPSHPDGAAGLGYLEVVHAHFLPLILAFSCLHAASIAEELSLGTMPFEAIYPAFAVVLAVDAVLFIGPLFLFTVKLWACRVKGLSDYMEFAATYVSGFDRKWLGADAPPEEPLLGNPDVQSLADLSNSVNIVRNMRIVPASVRFVVGLVIGALLPALPLFLFKYPIDKLIEDLFMRLVGI